MEGKITDLRSKFNYQLIVLGSIAGIEFGIPFFSKVSLLDSDNRGSSEYVSWA